MNKLIYIAVCLLCIALSQCKTTQNHTAATLPAPPPAAAAPVIAAAPNEAIADGLSIYNARCGRCHDLPSPGKYDQEEWADIMIKMSRKAHLTDDEKSHVMAYINSIAKP